MNLPPIGPSIPAKLSQATADLRERVGTTSEEAVTGRHSDLTQHLAGRIGKAMLSQKALNDIGLERAQLSLREGRLDIVQRSLTVIQENASGLDTRMQTALGMGDLARQDIIARDARAALDQIFSALNTRYSERFLFAGDATSTQPLTAVTDLLTDIRQIVVTAIDANDFAASVDTYFNTPGGGWQQTIYAGTATVSDPDTVTAIDPAITELVSGLAVLALAGPDEGLPLLTGNSEALHAATSRLSSAQAGLVDLRAELGVTQGQIARRMESLDVEETILTAAFNEMTARDQYEAAAELRELERNLEASYLLTARLTNLSLLNFLR